MLIIPFVVVLGTSLGTVNFSFGSFLGFLAEMVEQNEFPIVMGEEQNPLRLWSKFPYITSKKIITYLLLKEKKNNNKQAGHNQKSL